MKNKAVKDKNKKEVDTKKTALAALRSLEGKKIDKGGMSKAEQEILLIAIAQLVGVADENNIIRVK